MSAIYLEQDLLRLSFDTDDWFNQYPDIFQISNSSALPWYVDNTLTYEERNTIRSGQITRRAQTLMSITFELISNGYIEYTYIVSSEGPDYLTITIDNVEVVKVSGTSVSWTTKRTELSSGQHTIQFKYSKDSSVDEGSDAGAIALVDLKGVVPSYNAYYLVQDLSNGKYYANKEGSLTETPISALPELADFVEYGGEVPTVSMLSTIPRFKLLKCANTVENTENIPGLQYSVVGNLAPQLLKLKEPVRLTEQYQTGFKSVSFVSEKLETTSIKTLLSMDGITWYRFNAATEGNGESGVAATEASWSTVDYTTEAAVASGMTEEELARVDAEAFKLLYGDTGNNALYIAFIVECTALDHWLINSVRVEFTTSK